MEKLLRLLAADLTAVAQTPNIVPSCCGCLVAMIYLVTDSFQIKELSEVVANCTVSGISLRLARA